MSDTKRMTLTQLSETLKYSNDKELKKNMRFWILVGIIQIIPDFQSISSRAESLNTNEIIYEIIENPIVENTVDLIVESTIMVCVYVIIYFT
jgi:hypothetical protein